MDDDVEALGDPGDDGLGSGPVDIPARSGRALSVANRVSAELALALTRKKQGLPIFQFPPELPDKHRPYWTELVNSRPFDYFNEGDVPLLKLYVRCAYEVDMLDRQIEAQGHVIANARGNPIVNPNVLVRSIAETRLLALATKLRAQPASRYASTQDQKQQGKVARANAGARAIEESTDDDGDGDLLAGSRSLQ